MLGAVLLAALCFGPASASLAQKAAQKAEPTVEAAAAPPAVLSVDPISARIAKKGLKAIERELSRTKTPTPNELFALAGVRFLRAIEKAAQERYRYDPTGMSVVPGLSLPLPKNPRPKAFDPGATSRVLEKLIKDMAGVVAALDSIPDPALDEPGFAVTLSLDDLWIDVNRNGARDEAGPATETVMDLAGGALGANLRGMSGTLVRFDASDVAWLRGYAHLISGAAELLLAFDPAPASAAALPGWREALKYRAAPGLGYGEDIWADQLATLMLMARSTPDPKRMRAALDHFDETIANNRLFWAQVADEKDDLGEWIPNPQQKSALAAFEVSEELAASWLAVVDEFDKVLKGELLLGHWRFAKTQKGETVGVNLRKVFLKPGSADLALWLQGTAAVPYLEKGELASGDAWARFEDLAGDKLALFLLWFN